MKEPLILKSNLKELVRAQNYLFSIKEEKRWSADFFFRVEVSVLEAVRNAIVHGNKYGKDKVVVLNMFEDKDLI